ncbi:MAG: ADP-ribosylglycohydrolase family protein [Candidatus Saccharimonas sp.]
MKKMSEIGKNLLPAIAYGDAAGLPVETRSQTQIIEQHGRISRLIPVTDNPMFGGEFGVGTWSDDTQLSMAVARALIRARGFDMAVIAKEHVTEYERTPQIVKPNGETTKRGWGGSTTRSIERYIAGTSVDQSGKLGGAGNGVLMKLAPLAYWLIASGIDSSESYDNLDKFTIFTHNSPIAQVATRTHFDALNYLAHNEYNATDFSDQTYRAALQHEATLGESSNVVSNAIQYLRQESDMTASTILAQTDGKGFYVPHTLAMAYGAFMAHDGEFTSSIYEAVNLGGDTDSTAAIVAAMSLFRYGRIQQQPIDFTQTLEFDKLQKLSSQLVEAVA